MIHSFEKTWLSASERSFAGATSQVMAEEWFDYKKYFRVKDEKHDEWWKGEDEDERSKC